MTVNAFAERDEGSVMLNVNTKRSEHTFMLSEPAARRLLVDLIHETDAELAGTEHNEEL
jgi:hypothetical protein